MTYNDVYQAANIENLAEIPKIYKTTYLCAKSNRPIDVCHAPLHTEQFHFRGEEMPNQFHRYVESNEVQKWL